METDRDTPLGIAGKGVLAGMAAALALTGLVAAGRRWLSGERDARDPWAAEEISAGQALSEGPGLPPDMNRVTATFVQKVATGLFGASLSPAQQQLVGTAWHLAYGGFWGAAYALVCGSADVPGAALGPAHGLAVWAFGFAWLVPRMRLVLPPARQQPRTIALVVGVHVAYGALVALLYRLLARAGAASGRR